MEGWMTKKGGRISTWRRRWFVLGGEKLEYFTDQDRKVNKGHLLLKEITEVGHILHETRNFCIGLRTEKRLYVVSCDDESSFDQWLHKFQAIQPKELDSEFTNVPHSSLGNIEKQWLSLVGGGKKKKSNSKDPASPSSSKDPSKEEGSSSTPPSSSKDSKSSPTESVRNSLGANSSQDSPSAPASTRSTITPRGNNDGSETPKDSKEGSNVISTPRNTEQDISPSSPSPAPQSTSSPSSSQNQGGFGALHTSFDLDFGMTLNPALTASPLEESPFSETPDTNNTSSNTISIPTMTPIVDTNSTAAEDTPFE